MTGYIIRRLGQAVVVTLGVTIITFLMVFVIQQSQNKDSVAVHLKLNELLASHKRASNGLIGIEDASEEDLRRIANAYLRLAERAGQRPVPQTDVDRCVEQARSRTSDAEAAWANNAPACTGKNSQT